MPVATPIRPSARQQKLVELLTPIVKDCLTEWGTQIASTGVQMHGGMGYVEETGAAQHLCDGRITTIYEGTTGIQATDLVARKILRDGGAVIGSIIDSMRSLDTALARQAAAPFPALRTTVSTAVNELETAVAWLLEAERRDPRLPLAAAVPMLELTGTVLGGFELARAALRPQAQLDQGTGNSAFLKAKPQTVRFYATSVLPRAAALAHAVTEGSAAILDLDDKTLP